MVGVDQSGEDELGVLGHFTIAEIPKDRRRDDHQRHRHINLTGFWRGDRVDGLPERTMKNFLGLLIASSFVVVPFTAQAQGSQPAPSQPQQGAPPSSELVLEPKAIEILKASSERLAAAHTLSFTAVASYENPSRLGPPLVYTTTSDVTLKRPDKLQVITKGDGPASEFYYDGKTAMAFAPAENLVAVAEAPPTIDATLEAAYHYAAIYFPFTDVLVADNEHVRMNQDSATITRASAEPETHCRTLRPRKSAAVQ
jgi:hypothetical protein